jgi:putative NADH-flavin reductase
MKVILFGANGRVGSIVARMLLEEGHSVRACVHGSSESLIPHKNLEIVQTDVHDSESIEKALESSDAVISTLGSWGTPTKDILEQAMKHIIPLMQENNMQRIITLTGSDARAKGDRLSIVHNVMHTFILVSPARKILKDGERHIALLEDSELDWTILRSPIMNEKGSPSFTLSPKRPKPWMTIHRHAVAEAIVEQIKDASQIKKAPYLHR